VRNPYTTGGWVSGHEHYGRETLIAHILESENDAVWVVGNRRMGKPSLLRQLELLAATSGVYVPLFWDMQGSSNLEELKAELLYAVEDEAERFAALVVDLQELSQRNVIGVIRGLRRQARNAGKSLLLLCDEAEALLRVAEEDPKGLAGLRKVFLSAGGLRVVLASTKVLSRVNTLTQDWETSPFLFGFGLRNLAGLDDAATAALIRRAQDATPVRVEDEQVRQISQLTGNHPYLTQVLCSRLFVESGELRPITPEDLALDGTLRDYFQNDYRWMSAGERHVLLSIARGNRTVEAIAADTGLGLAVVQDFVYSQDRLGTIHGAAGGLEPANEFLRRWLAQNHLALQRDADDSELRDDTTRELIRTGQEQEAGYVLEQLGVWRANLNELELQRAQFGIRVPLDLINEINRAKIEIERLEERLGFISPQVVEAMRNGSQQAANGTGGAQT
jgi:hypothetical protein